MMKGYEQKKYPVATKRYVQWLELESDEEAISVNIAACIQKVCNGRRFVMESDRWES